jgi:hypothetical protein
MIRLNQSVLLLFICCVAFSQGVAGFNEEIRLIENNALIIKHNIAPNVENFDPTDGGSNVKREDDTYSNPHLQLSYSGDRVKVRGYYRKDGTYVRPHTRSKPKKK